MGWFAGAFFGKDNATLEKMKAVRERKIEKLKAEIAEINAELAKRSND